ncbi:NAD(P)-dependent oxidoreductase [Roseivivax sediminis]|uniref:NAD(P)-dependent oxidoreductase n=1 Tax=Roseivivax sediminis TaxID=936889 RepID=UPI001CB6C638|nr:NAD(P)-dependent oxidoreductase [Roseivivax sediminis]
MADEIGNAEGIAMDLSAGDPGIGDRPVGAIAVLFTDQKVAGLSFAQDRGMPYVNISPGIIELGPEVAAYIQRPDASAVVLGTEWLVGATSVPAMAAATAFSHVEDIRIGALLDTEDAFGPAAETDLERQTQAMAAALERREGAFAWRTGDTTTSRFRAVDGTEMQASALSPNDLLGLSMATGAPNVRFDLAIGVSSSRRAGEPLSAEILIELSGTDPEGSPLAMRFAVVHPGGQMPLTGLGVAMVLESLTGLGGQAPTQAGLYFPYQLLDAGTYFARLRHIGGSIVDLEPEEKSSKTVSMEHIVTDVRRAA